MKVRLKKQVTPVGVSASICFLVPVLQRHKWSRNIKIFKIFRRLGWIRYCLMISLKLHERHIAEPQLYIKMTSTWTKLSALATFLSLPRYMFAPLCKNMHNFSSKLPSFPACLVLPYCDIHFPNVILLNLIPKTRVFSPWNMPSMKWRQTPCTSFWHRNLNAICC